MKEFRRDLAITLVIGTCLSFAGLGAMYWLHSASPTIASTDSQPPQQRPETMSDTIEFDETVWELVGPIAAADIGRSVMRKFNANAYRSDRPDQRLIRLDMLPMFADGSVGAISQMTFIQTRSGDRWVNTGLDESIGSDGVRIVTTQVNGELHGPYRAYYPSGQVKMEMTYVQGNRQGAGRGYYESGKLQWEAQYLNDREVSGKSWKEDGSPN